MIFTISHLRGRKTNPVPPSHNSQYSHNSGALVEASMSRKPQGLSITNLSRLARTFDNQPRKQWRRGGRIRGHPDPLSPHPRHRPQEPEQVEMFASRTHFHVMRSRSKGRT